MTCEIELPKEGPERKGSVGEGATPDPPPITVEGEKELTSCPLTSMAFSHTCAHAHAHSNLRVPKEEERTERISEELRLDASHIYEIQLSTHPRDYQTLS